MRDVVIIERLKCLRCGYKWFPRPNIEGKIDVRICPRCKSARWNNKK